MNKQKKAFTLAELMLGIAILIVITGLIIPVAKVLYERADKDRVKHAYSQIIYIIRSLDTDPYLYPTGRFDNPKEYVNAQTGATFKEKGKKFTQAFISKLNVLKIKELNPGWDWDSKQNGQAGWDKRLGYDDPEMTEERDIGEYKRTCVLTNNKVYFCLPSITFKNYTIDESWSDEKKKSEKKLHDRFAEEGNVVISVFLSDDHSIKNGFYFSVNKFGKVSIVPPENVTCYYPLVSPSEENNGESEEDQVDYCSCGYKDLNGIYINQREYNQCKLDSYLQYTK